MLKCFFRAYHNGKEAFRQPQPAGDAERSRGLNREGDEEISGRNAEKSDIIKQIKQYRLIQEDKERCYSENGLL